ncbi:tyrosinase [Lentzea aerocolonigenes]|uniref:Tyrosinase n=1 Tax=Lentzea aerocolonigenes TaxID=68170 RepID=A0A0F0GI82_LENAE|nr:tyrosinase family protein [Lentzea aerocolonigenes]KJK42211.1 tyrosinase [Lentzea aerocolonigenes]
MIRKNQATLTSEEKARFVAAMLELKRTGRYDEFVVTHQEFAMSDSDVGDRLAHRAPSFLPWHRRFLLDFERALQEVDPAVTLPYWDWTDDRSTRSSLWAPDFLGGTGRTSDGKVMTGPFAGDTGKWKIIARTDSRSYLCRTLAVHEPALPTAEDVLKVLAEPRYDVRPWNSSSSSGLRNLLEGWRGPNLHNRVHVWVGGHMATGASPNDPVFWLHHCFIDLLWAQWQAEHGASYEPKRREPGVVGAADAMKPWGDVTPQDMLDHRAFYTYDVDE